MHLSNKLNVIEGVAALGLFINLASNRIMGTETESGTETLNAK